MGDGGGDSPFLISTLTKIFQGSTFIKQECCTMKKEQFTKHF